jgi:hypothetical protein
MITHRCVCSVREPPAVQTFQRYQGNFRCMSDAAIVNRRLTG